MTTRIARKPELGDQLEVRRLAAAPREHAVVLDGEVHAEVAKTVIHLAHSLGIDVSAEGVETPGQLERLKEFPDVVFEFVVENGEVTAMKQVRPEGEFRFPRK